MKRLGFIALFIFLFLTSCIQQASQDRFYITNMRNDNDSYYLDVDTDIDLKEYIVSNIPYTVEYKDKVYNSTDDLFFELDYMNNEFIIECKENKVVLNFYKIVYYNIIFKDNKGDVLYDYRLDSRNKIDEKIIKPHLTIPEGYDWYGKVLKDGFEVNLSELKIQSDIELIPVYEGLCYNVVIKCFDKEEIYSFPVGKTIDIYEYIPGYICLGLFSGSQNVNGLKYEPSMGTYFEFKHKPKQFTIYYHYNDIVEEQAVLYNTTISLLNLDLIGYSFDYWMYNNDIFNDETYKFTENIHLYAKLTPNVYKITYTNIENEYSENVSYNEWKNLPTPKKEGYHFDGWYYNDKKIYSADYWKIAEDVVLTARWFEKNIVLNLEPYDGVVDASCEVNVSGIVKLPTPTLENHVFLGWYWDEDFIKPVTQLNIHKYYNEKLYALYEVFEEKQIDSFVITKYNFHETTYDNLAIFDSSQSGFTSLYWHKIGIKKFEDEYFVSSIAISGETVTSMVYDYVILAYSKYERFNDFSKLDVAIGDKVIFDHDIETLSSKDINVTVSFYKVDNTNRLTKVKEDLESLYNEYQELNENIELITESNGLIISWKSSNNDIISSTGIYHKPNVTTDVTLSAYVNNELIYSFTVSVIGNSDHYDALATGYIYTPYTITQNAMNTLDIIYCAFLDIDKDANFTNATSMKNKINTYILPLAEISGTKVVISVNQGSSGAFSAVAAREALREKLATNILNFIIEMNIHGIDIDWETPASNEATNFTLLMKAIYEKVKKYNSNLLVTAAIGGGKWQPPKYDLPHSKDYLDYVNLMTYSMATGNGYYQNALYKSSKGATLTSCSIDESIDLYNGYGVTNNKILIGIPFYTTVQTGCEGPGSKVGSGKSIWYKELFSTYKLSDTMKEYFDEECGVPYRYDAVNKIFISFDNEQSIKVKCEYIHAKGLAGIMYWQYGQDVDDMLSNAIAKYIDS